MYKILLSLSSLLLLSACNSVGQRQVNCRKIQQYQNPDYVDYVSPADICNQNGMDGNYSRYYDRFIIYTAPNGGEIPIYGMKGVSNEQLLRAYNILSMYLNEKDATELAPFKGQIADHMAIENAVLVMPHGADRQTFIPSGALRGQPLYSRETPLDGSLAYIHNDWEQRDAAYEEILHLVHDYGIGTRMTPGVLKNTWQQEVQAAMEHALRNKIWPAEDDQDIIREWRREGSLSQEYLASVVDAYYGLWDAWPGDASMWGAYQPKNRAELPFEDPKAWELVRKYFPLYMTYMSRIDANFEGTFSLAYDPATPYTAKSRYLLHARLTGTKNSNLLGNDQDNILMGNSGNNILDGAAGADAVQVPGPSDKYVIENGMLIEKANTAHRDTLRNIERLIFQDKTISLKSPVDL